MVRNLVSIILGSCMMSMCLSQTVESEFGKDPRSPRLWTSANGSKMLASYVRTEDGIVELQGKDKRSIKAKIELLSDIDKAFIKRHFADDLERKAGDIGAKFPFEKDIKGPVGWIRKQKKGMFPPDKYMYVYQEIMNYYVNIIPAFEIIPNLLDNTEIFKDEIMGKITPVLDKEFVVTPQTRRNLLSGTPMEFKPLPHEPQWENVTQTLRMVKDNALVTFYQTDVFTLGNDKKFVLLTTNFYIPSKMSPVTLITFEYEEFYNEDSYFYTRFANRRFEENAPFDPDNTQMESFMLASAEKNTMASLVMNTDSFTAKNEDAKYLNFYSTKKPVIYGLFKKIEDYYFHSDKSGAPPKDKNDNRGKGYYAVIKDAYQTDAYTKAGKCIDLRDIWGEEDPKVKNPDSVRPPKNLENNPLNLFKERSALIK